jgi:tetratricopeptide (TPR) repeat protein
LLAGSVAVAQEPAQRELSPDERARELYLRGDRLYAEGSYDEAIVALKDAYQLSARAPLLYDIANAYERLGQYEEALHYLNQYAPSAPEHQRHIVLKRIRSLEQRAEERRQREGPGSGPLAAAPLADTSSPVAGSVSSGLEEEPGPPPPYLAYAIGGAGVLGIGAGLVLGLSAQQARSDAEAACVDNGSGVFCPASARDTLSSARHRAVAADIAWGLGLAALGVGVYLVLDASSESGASTALRSEATAAGAGVSLVQTF